MNHIEHLKKIDPAFAKLLEEVKRVFGGGVIKNVRVK